MRNLSKLFATAAVAAGLAAAGAPAHALQIVPIATGPFSLPGNPSGVIPSNEIVKGTDSWDFTFSILGGTYKTQLQMQASKLSNGAPTPLTFTLYKGPTGSGSFWANSAGTSTAASLNLNLSPGNYYMQLDRVQAPKELVTGGLTLLSSVPEPASWATMMLGLAAIGGAARTRRRMAGAAA
jgi:hypothetical protein